MTELEFKNFLSKSGLSEDIQKRYPAELTRLKEKGFDFYNFDKETRTESIIEIFQNIFKKGSLPVLYDVGVGMQRVPKGTQPKNFDSAELVIRVIKLYLLFIEKAQGRASSIDSIVPLDESIKQNIKLLEITKRQYNFIFEYFEEKIDEINKNNEILITSKSKSQSQIPQKIKGINKIYYGVPGCGKSHFIKELIDDYYPKDQFVRTIFHPDYSYSDFVGQILPSKQGQSITYEFKPGVFTEILYRAKLNPNNNYFIVIEEINRGNASAIFGDIFQLLDRDESGQSKYAISNSDIQKFLKDKNPNFDENELVRIPANLSIYSTMNTSDQNVFVLDTAFKRRWEFELIYNDIKKNIFADKLYIPNTQISWSDFHQKINKKIIENQESNGNFEDKQIGPFFIDNSCLSPIPLDKDSEKINKFSYKVLEYLWNDVSKLNRIRWFGNNIKTLEELIESFRKSGFSDLPNNLID